jgi:hypothetical protein
MPCFIWTVTAGQTSKARRRAEFEKLCALSSGYVHRVQQHTLGNVTKPGAGSRPEEFAVEP